MAAIFADFPSGQKGLYGTDTSKMLNGIWAQLVDETGQGSVSLVADPDPNVGSAGYVLKTYANNVQGRTGPRFALPTTANTEGFACRLWCPSLPPTNNSGPVICFNNGANATLFAIRVLSTGAIEARSTYTNSGTQYGVTSGPVVTANAYHHIEIKGKADAAAGTIEVRVNGVVALNLSGLNTGTGPIAQLIFGSYIATTDTGSFESIFHWKDVVFWDTTGTENNDFLGSVSVYDQIEDGDLSFNWTASSGTTGYNLINEGDSGPVDTSYISADSSPPAASSFSMADLPADVTSVRALFPIARMEKTDGGDCTVQMGLSPDGTNWDDGADRPITTAFTYWWDVSEVSPATAVAWTPVEANSLEFRINRTL